jgi:hypothetical protein
VVRECYACDACGKEFVVEIGERGVQGVDIRGDDDGEPVDEGLFWFGFIVGVGLSIWVIGCIQEFAR